MLVNPATFHEIDRAIHGSHPGTILKVLLPRTNLGILAQVPFGLGFLFVVVSAWFVRYWRHLQWVIAVPGLLSLAYPCLVLESPRWLVSRDNPDRARDIIREAARRNKVDK